MADVVLRRAGLGDSATLAALAVAFRDFLEQTQPSYDSFESAFRRLLTDPDTEIILAEADNRGLGYVQIRYRFSAWAEGLEAELEDVFITAAARRSGIGRRVVESAIDRARARGCVALGLTTNEHNDAALRLYEQLGLSAAKPRWRGGRQLWLVRDLRKHR